MTVMNSINFDKKTLLKINQTLSTYNEIKYQPTNEINYYKVPQFQSCTYHYAICPTILTKLFKKIKYFFKYKLEYPIFITIFIENFEIMADGFYILDMNNDNYQLISEVTQKYSSNPRVKINYFINLESVEQHQCYANYVKSCIEIGRLDEFLTSNETIFKDISRVFLPSNKETKSQNIDMTAEFLTQTTILVLHSIER